MIEEKLTGTSLSEQHRILNGLLLSFKEKDIDSLVSTCTSENNEINLIFLAKVANKYKRPSIICNLLKSEDSLIVSKALKSTWFFDGVTCGDITNADYFFKNIFPQIGLSTRCRVISQLSIYLKVYDVADQFYVRIKDYYGAKEAVKLLPVCSERLIEKEFDNDLHVPYNKMKFIYKLYPKCTMFYIEKYLKSGQFDYIKQFGPIIETIAKDMPKYFLEIFAKYFETFAFNLNYNATVLILKNNPRCLIEDKDIYEQFNSKAIAETLDDSTFNEFLMKKVLIFKSSHDYEETYKFIQLRCKKTAPEHFMKLFKLKFNISLLDTDINLYIPIVEELPIEKRISWANRMIKKSSSEEKTYAQYLSCDAGFKYYMDEIEGEVTNYSYGRSCMVIRMLHCCKNNNDESALLKLLKYVAKRFRNDKESLNEEFLCNIRTLFKLPTLSSEHWNVIDEIVNVQLSFEYISTDVIRDILFDKIIYNFKNNIEIDQIVNQFIKHDIPELDFDVNEPEILNKYFEMKLNRYKVLIEKEKDEGELINHIKNCLTLIDNYGKKYPKCKDDLNKYEWLMQQLHYYMSLKAKDINYVKLIFNLNAETKRIFAKLYFQSDYNATILKYVLKYDALIVKDSVDSLNSKLYSYDFTRLMRSYSKIKAYLNNTIGSVIREQAMKKIEELESLDEPDDSVGNHLALLAIFSKSDQYQSLIEKYIPINMKIDAFNESSKHNYNVLKPVIESFKHFNPPPSYEMTARFAKGDYLKLVLPSMLALCRKKKEIETIEFINKLSSEPVSVKKHSVRLAYFYYEKKALPAFYKDMWAKEPNTTIRNVLFNKTFKLLKFKTDGKNGNFGKECLEIIKNFVETLNKKDKQIFNCLTTVNQVHDDLFNGLCEILWDNAKKFNDDQTDITSEMIKFVDNIINHVDKLNNNFCDVLIDDYEKYMIKHSDLASSLLNFSAQYVIKSNSTEIQANRIDKVCKMLKNIINDHWNNKILNARKSVKHFIKICCDKLINRECFISMLPVMNSLMTTLKSALPFEAVFNINLLMKLTSIFENIFISDKENLWKNIQVRRQWYSIEMQMKIVFVSLEDNILQQLLDEFVVEILNLFDDMIKQYGPDIYYTYFPVFNHFLRNKVNNKVYINDGKEDNKILLHMCLIKKLLKNNTSNRHVLKLAIDLLPTFKDYKEEYAVSDNTDRSSSEDSNFCDCSSEISVSLMEMRDDLIKLIAGNADMGLKIRLNNRLEISSEVLFAH